MATARQHRWEIQGVHESGERTAMILVPAMEVARKKSKAAVSALLLQMFENGAEKVHLYHSYPSPGPQRRFTGWYDTQGTFHNS